MIESLKPNQIFVFGSNISGHHAGGAARQAFDNFGAEWGIGEGMTGRCYALPTMEGKDSLIKAVREFWICTQNHPEHVFLVTPVGTGIAGYPVSEVSNIFNRHHWENNVIFVDDWKTSTI